MKYAALGAHLKALPASLNETTLTFMQVEKIIQTDLPPSAFKYREWWANQEGGSRAPHWRAAGFAVDRVNFARKQVTFRRSSAALGYGDVSGRERTDAAEVLRRDLEKTLREANRRAGEEEGRASGRLTQLLDKRGGLGAARYFLQSRRDAAMSKGFRALMEAGRHDLTLEYVVLQPRFQALFTPQELEEARSRLGWLVDPTISDIVHEIEAHASRHRFGNLQEIRQRIKGKQRLARQIFHSGPKYERYTYHRGGRTELQFNVGLEECDDGNRYLRHGVALSLERDRSFYEICDETVERIGRFNAFMDTHADEFTDFLMYSWSGSEERGSGDHVVRQIDSAIVKLGMFIFVGRRQIASGVSVETILRDFDRLLPLYQFVETGEMPIVPGAQANDDFVPRLPRKPSQTTMTVAQRVLDRQLRHNDIQFALGEYLRRRHGKDSVCAEYLTRNGTKVDIALRIPEGLIFYEIKVALRAQDCIRQALGQLLEYSYWPGARRARSLIVVGEPACDDEARRYIQRLRNEFELPVEYRQFDMEALAFR